MQIPHNFKRDNTNRKESEDWNGRITLIFILFGKNFLWTSYLTSPSRNNIKIWKLCLSAQQNNKICYLIFIFNILLNEKSGKEKKRCKIVENCGKFFCSKLAEIQNCKKIGENFEESPRATNFQFRMFVGCKVCLCIDASDRGYDKK